MRRSNLEIYLEILKILSAKKALNITSILRKANINFNQSMNFLDFLIENNLIERTYLKREVLFSITPKGTLLLKALVKIEEASKIEEKSFNLFVDQVIERY